MIHNMHCIDYKYMCMFLCTSVLFQCYTLSQITILFISIICSFSCNVIFRTVATHKFSLLKELLLSLKRKYPFFILKDESNYMVMQFTFLLWVGQQSYCCSTECPFIDMKGWHECGLMHGWISLNRLVRVRAHLRISYKPTYVGVFMQTYVILNVWVYLVVSA